MDSLLIVSNIQRRLRQTKHLSERLFWDLLQGDGSRTGPAFAAQSDFIDDECLLILRNLLNRPR